MTFKQFNAWCNDRACDGCWGLRDAITCTHTIDEVNKFYFWRREKEWQKINKDRHIVEKIVEPINKMIDEYIKNVSESTAGEGECP